jgi:hypothetical protein
MNHLVITRLMIGVSRPGAFALHGRVLLETTYRSMVAQTVEDFQWVVVTDDLIDKASRRMIEKRFAKHPNFHLVTMNSFTKDGVGLDVVSLCERFLGTTLNVFTTRIDDDDALRTDFLEQARRTIIESGAAFASFSQRHGVAVASEHLRHGPTVSREGASAGMTVLSPDVRGHHVHSFNHRRVHSRVAGLGGTAIHAEDPGPHFLSGYHAESDSRERARPSRVQRRLDSYAVSDPQDAAYRALLASFGLRRDFDARISTIRKEYIDWKPPIFTEAPNQQRAFGRLGLKKQYVSMAKPLWDKLETAKPADRARIEMQLHLIRQAFYLV